VVASLHGSLKIHAPGFVALPYVVHSTQYVRVGVGNQQKTVGMTLQRNGTTASSLFSLGKLWRTNYYDMSQSSPMERSISYHLGSHF
jgi:hypothetical protein